MSDWFIKQLFLYIPLSLIGAWRWSYWLVRRVTAATYRPKPGLWPAKKPKPTVSVVTPVYNEDPVVFEEAMQSWIKNGVDEIVAVIDKSNTRHIVDFERRYVNNNAIPTKCRLLVTPLSGKRAALCDGIEVAHGDLIALVDSDTVWDDQVLQKTLPYFLDEKVGGSTVAQRLQNPNTVANIMFDMLLWSRYREEVPFLLATGNAFNTLSGRTAFYRREAIFNPRYDNMHLLRHEFFFGTRGISGDDKRLTHLIIEQGWHTAFAVGPTVYTPGMNTIRKFLKQRLRWTRNSWRADLRAVNRGWVWSHPSLAIFMIDRFIQPIFMLIGPVVMAFALINHEWLFAGILAGWWLVSRFVRVFGYFKTYPTRIIYLPAYIVYGYVNAVIKIYALATLIENSWATRWSKSRVQHKSWLRKSYTLASGSIAVVIFTLFVAHIVVALRHQLGSNIPISPPVDISLMQAQVTAVNRLDETSSWADASRSTKQIRHYTVQPGDTVTTLSFRFGMDIEEFKKLNNIRVAKQLLAGQTVDYYAGAVVAR